MILTGPRGRPPPTSAAPYVSKGHSLNHPLGSLSTTRELCAVAGAQDVVRGHIELFGMLLYVYRDNKTKCFLLCKLQSSTGLGPPYWYPPHAPWRLAKRP